MSEKIKCISCGSGLDEKSVVFQCPACGKRLVRCHKCRKLAIKYKCECGFEGP
jgi:hypothetical protein